ncbi:MAG TPA: hypothetical protein VEH52_10450 [Gaiellaceae bacterium]|nr:hypothetical protein [Gaiellaceae bacterium]
MNQPRLLVLAAALFAATVCAVTVKAADRPSASHCGGIRWRMKTLSDTQRNLVRLNPASSTIGAIDALRPPTTTPLKRTTQFQKQTWEVVAQIVSYKREGDEIRLSLFDDGDYMNAVIPGPPCLGPASRDRAAMAAAWTQFESRCGHATSATQPLGAVAYVDGVGFWGGRTSRHGASPNGAELHPVTSLRLVAGCGS